MADKTASFTIPIDVDSNAVEESTNLEELRRKIAGAQEAVKDLMSAQRALRGSSDEVKDARTQLKSKIEAERDAISRSNLALVKQGTNYEKLARHERESAKALLEQKKARQAANVAEQAAASNALLERMLEQKKAHDATGKAVSTLGGPVAQLRDRFESLQTVLGGAKGAAGLFTVGAAALTVGVLAAVAALVAGTVAVVNLTIAFGKFVVEGANTLRTLRIMREAASGSAANATALGHQIDALANKVPTARAELNDLALDMTRSFMGTRVSGQGLVDTFNAVAQESEAMGKQAGAQIQSIIDRSKQWGRMGLGLFELQGTGISFEDVAGRLAKDLKIGLDDARLQLRMGWVDVNAGAQAIREAVEKKFARLNLARMLDFNVIKQRLSEAFTLLTSGVNLEPLLKSFEEVSDLFKASTVAGSALHDIVTDLGNALVGGAADGAHLVTMGLKQLIIWAYQADIAFLKFKKGIAINDKIGGIISFRDLIFGVKLAIASVGAALVAAAVAVAALVATFKGLEAVYDLFTGIDEWVTNLGENFRAGFASLGSAMLEGILAGIKGAWASLKAGVSSIADGVKNTFKSVLGIHSPSVPFKDYGRQSMRGYELGTDEGAPAANRAVARAVEVPQTTSAAPAASASARGGPISVTVEINVGAGAHGQEVARQLSAPDFLASLTKAVEEALLGAGIPTGQPAGG